MSWKTRLSTRGMVLYVLLIHPERPLTVKEIQAEILEKFECSIKRQTVVSALDESQYIIGNINQTEERRGVLKLPTQCFSIYINKNLK